MKKDILKNLTWKMISNTYLSFNVIVNSQTHIGIKKSSIPF